MIVTFYSYKGGVGRSMALVNVGVYLASRGAPVILVDWDLEAPGLERFFDGWRVEAEEYLGVIDLLLEYRSAIARPPQAQEIERGSQPVPARNLGKALGFASPRERLLDLGDALNLPAGMLRLLPAGRRSGKRFAEYAASVQAFDWAAFYSNWEGEAYLEWFRQELLAENALILVDSRTGVTEIGGVCVYQLADIVVMFCAANQNNLNGTTIMAEAFSRPLVQELRGDRPLSILPVPSRIAENEEVVATNDFINDFTQAVGSYYRKLGLDPYDAARLLLIPQISFYSFRERIAVRETGNSRFHSPQLIRPYVALADMLVRLAPRGSVLARKLGSGESLDPIPLSEESAEERAEAESRKADFFLVRRLRSAFLAWEPDQRSTALLLQDPVLEQVEAWSRDHPDDLLPGEALFIEKSRKFQEQKQRRNRRVITMTLALILLLLGLSLVLAVRREQMAVRFASWGLPRDLSDRIPQLAALKLPSAVNRIDWLDGDTSLKRLDLSGTNVSDLRGIPVSLVALDLSATPIADLRSLPWTLEELNLRYTRIRNLNDMPRGLRSLSLDEVPIDNLAGLPPNLLSLSLDAENLSTIPALPKSLQTLSLAKYQDPRLPALPAGLFNLSLSGTKLRTLEDLPPFLQSLSLINNSDLALTALPSGLNRLKVDLSSKDIDLGLLPPALEVLDLRRALVRSITGAPRTLRELALVEIPIRDIGWISGSLRSLTLGPQEQPKIETFPNTLEALALPWSSGIDLSRLPRSLRVCDLSFSKLDSLSGLPENLETLILNGSNVSSLDRLPPRLHRLEIRWTPVKSLPRLPPTLSSLDLSGCRNVTALTGLPPSLKELNISDTSISILKDLPAGLKSLDIRGSRISRIGSSLPSGLEVLRLSPLQVQELGSLPRSLKELYFDDAPRRP
jgi:hypothetical protein